MPGRGRLFLGINDNGVLDNSGGFRVVVSSELVGIKFRS